MRKEKTSFLNVPQVEVILSSDEFTPIEQNGEVFVFANIPLGVSGNRQYSLSNRNSCTIDCGMTLKIPKGYRIIIDLIQNLKDRGLVIYNNTIIGDNRLCFGVRNVGREIVVIDHLVAVASIKIEPIYPLKFKIL